MNKEEIKAIDYLQFCYDISTIGNESLPKLGIALNLIFKLQKELDKKDKIIYLIAERLSEVPMLKTKEFSKENELDSIGMVEMTKQEIIEYFYKKVEEENE